VFPLEVPLPPRAAAGGFFFSTFFWGGARSQQSKCNRRQVLPFPSLPRLGVFPCCGSLSGIGGSWSGDRSFCVGALNPGPPPPDYIQPQVSRVIRVSSRRRNRHLRGGGFLRGAMETAPRRSAPGGFLHPGRTQPPTLRAPIIVRRRPIFLFSDRRRGPRLRGWRCSPGRSRRAGRSFYLNGGIADTRRVFTGVPKSPPLSSAAADSTSSAYRQAAPHCESQGSACHLRVLFRKQVSITLEHR